MVYTIDAPTTETKNQWLQSLNFIIDLYDCKSKSDRWKFTAFHRAYGNKKTVSAVIVIISLSDRYYRLTEE